MWNVDDDSVLKTCKIVGKIPPICGNWEITIFSKMSSRKRSATNMFLS